MKITFLQTADPFRYTRMMALTGATVIEHCRRRGYSYESYTGIKRGVWPWQATYNRIVQLQELVDRGFSGWAFYLDADAYVVDLDFDLVAYLADKMDYSAILTPAMASGERWDVNVGVCAFNCGHPGGRHLIAEWNSSFAAVTDERLAEAEIWLECDNDQDLFQQMLVREPCLMDDVFFQDTSLINSSYAAYIRQHLRGYSASFEEREEAIAQATRRVLPEASIKEGYGRRFREQVVAGVYRGLLRRSPDPEGLSHAAGDLEMKGVEIGILNLIVSIMGSEEYRSSN